MEKRVSESFLTDLQFLIRDPLKEFVFGELVEVIKDYLRWAKEEPRFAVSFAREAARRMKDASEALQYLARFAETLADLAETKDPGERMRHYAEIVSIMRKLRQVSNVVDMPLYLPPEKLRDLVEL